MRLLAFPLSFCAFTSSFASCSIACNFVAVQNVGVALVRWIAGKLDVWHNQRSLFPDIMLKLSDAKLKKKPQACKWFISKIRNTYNENMIKQLVYIKKVLWLLAPVAGHNVCHLNRPNANVIQSS